MFYLLALIAMISKTYQEDVIPVQIFHRMLRNAFNNDPIILETACDSSECYSIYDVLVYSDYTPQIIRIFGISEKHLGHSVSVLNFPKRLSLETLDTGTWALQPGYIQHCPYQIGMVESPFWTGTLSRDSNTSKSLLMIGLGGANFNNYLAEKYEFLNITVVEISQLVADLAKRWFPSNWNNRHRIVVKDGVEFLEEEASTDQHFDVILLDATYSDNNREFTSPVQEFLQPEVVKNIAKLIGNEGALIINVALGILSEDRWASIQKLISFYQDFFKEVLVVHPTEYNWIFVCRHLPITSHTFNDLPPAALYYAF